MTEQDIVQEDELRVLSKKDEFDKNEFEIGAKSLWRLEEGEPQRIETSQKFYPLHHKKLLKNNEFWCLIVMFNGASHVNGTPFAAEYPVLSYHLEEKLKKQRPNYEGNLIKDIEEKLLKEITLKNQEVADQIANKDKTEPKPENLNFFENKLYHYNEYKTYSEVSCIDENGNRKHTRLHDKSKEYDEFTENCTNIEISQATDYQYYEEVLNEALHELGGLNNLSSTQILALEKIYKLGSQEQVDLMNCNPTLSAITREGSVIVFNRNLKRGSNKPWILRAQSLIRNNIRISARAIAEGLMDSNLAFFEEWGDDIELKDTQGETALNMKKGTFEKRISEIKTKIKQELEEADTTRRIYRGM